MIGDSLPTLYDLLHSLVFGIGVMFAVIGASQLFRTIRFGSAVTNANEVIRRSGILIGIGAAFLFAAR